MYFKVDTYKNVQQTPKPEAQLPSTVPLFPEHSVWDRQVPRTGVAVVDDLAVH